MTIDGKVWPTVEHYFQAMKSLIDSEHEIIRLARGPGEAKKLGQAVRMRSDWEDVKFTFMLIALRAKFSQHPQMKEILIKTGDRDIYEDSPYDKIWGTGIRGGIGVGSNKLGKALMQLRLELNEPNK